MGDVVVGVLLLGIGAYALWHVIFRSKLQQEERLIDLIVCIFAIVAVGVGLWRLLRLASVLQWWAFRGS